jgi:ribokinase
MRRVIVVGSINVDLILSCRELPRPGETGCADDRAESFGGKGVRSRIGPCAQMP